MNNFPLKIIRFIDWSTINQGKKFLLISDFQSESFSLNLYGDDNDDDDDEDEDKW